MMQLKVSPVYSRTAHSGEIAKLSGELFLREHQVKTYRAIQNPEVDVVFNTAMTGDGKSLAAYLPALVDNRSVLAMYPTNALIQDQEEQIKSYWASFKRDITPGRMFSERLYELRAELQLQRQANAINYLRQQHEILLTNPDIFNLIANFEYVSERENPDWLLQTILDSYDVFLFDEFHLYDVSQVVSVLTAMLHVIEQTRQTRQRKKFVFLSATPSPLLLGCLERSGVRYEIVKGDYQSENIDGREWTQICAPFTLHFHAVGRQTEAWVHSHYRELAAWFTDNPGSRGAIIVNSVAAAKRIVTFLKERRDAGDFPLSVGENTGMSNKAERDFALRESDLLVGTSTVDVGVDFKINYLVFEALDAGSWIQRLGRLGRHRGYERDGKEVAFNNFVGHSLLPKYVVERIEGAGLLSPSEIDKATLIETMRQERKERRIFSPVNDFRYYRKCWGWMHPARVINTLEHPRLRDNYASVRGQLTETYGNVFEVDISERVKWYYAISQKMPEIVDSAVVHFRGETPFTCGILDETDGHVKDYNLLWVLRNAETEWMDKQEFMREIERRGLQPHKYRYVDVYLRVLKYRAEPERLRICHRDAILDRFPEDAYRTPRVLSGFRIDGHFQDLTKINRSLRRKKFLCLIRKERAEELKIRLRLPPLFGIFPLIDSEGNELSVVFSKDALLLQSQPYIWAKEESA